MPTKRKAHYKKKLSGIYGKNNKPIGKSKAKWRYKRSGDEPEAVDADLEVKEEVKVQEPVAEPPKKEEQPAPQPPVEQPKPQPQPSKPMSRAMMQLLLAVLFAGMGVILLLGTILLNIPMQNAIENRKQDRLEIRMDLSTMIGAVLPSMKVDDELNDMVLRALEKQEATYRAESKKTVNEIEALRGADENIQNLLLSGPYADADFNVIAEKNKTTNECLSFIQGPVNDIDAQIAEMGVATLKQQIDEYKGSVKTETSENEEGETVTETVVEGGLIPTLQKEKDALQKKHDEIKGKLDTLDEYLADIDPKITTMYNRLELKTPAGDRFAKMKAISEYVTNVHPDDNIYLQDIVDKLASFPGESREEDDILFIMQIEEDTGLRFPTVNYGQDYQLTKLSNGMMLCYEVYSLPYISTYQGLKNLIAYFNDNDEFYASVYTLSMQYNPMDQTIRGNIVIMHYYLLSEDAEYVPPVVEGIKPGIDGIFGEVTDTHLSKKSPYSFADLHKWLKEDGMSFEEVVDFLKSEGYPATELAWILKEEYTSPDQLPQFLEDYGEEGVEYDIDYAMNLLECDLTTLIEIYKTPDGGSNKDETTEDDEKEEDKTEDNTNNENAKEYTFADVQEMLNQDKTLAEVRDEMVANGNDALDLAQVLKDGLGSEEEVVDFLKEHDYNTLDSVLDLFDCTEDDLKSIVNY